jgi:hypothetical protein
MNQNNPYRGAFLLILAAAGLLTIAAATGRGDITTATLVLAGTGCFIAGVFLLALHKGEPLDPEIVALLPAQGTINIATLCADLGLQGDAWFIPKDGTVIEVIPVAGTLPEPPRRRLLLHHRGTESAPSGSPDLRPAPRTVPEKHALEIPDEEKALLACITEVCDDLLEIAERPRPSGTARTSSSPSPATGSSPAAGRSGRPPRSAAPWSAARSAACLPRSPHSGPGLRRKDRALGRRRKKRDAPGILRPAGPAARGAGPGSSR